jgi:allophanate hydrolase subunit 2
MVRGAIQVPASGHPIVLGPDHPTTGGYPVLATVVRADTGAIMARSVGASVRFVRSHESASELGERPG